MLELLINEFVHPFFLEIVPRVWSKEVNQGLAFPIQATSTSIRNKLPWPWTQNAPIKCPMLMHLSQVKKIK